MVFSAHTQSQARSETDAKTFQWRQGAQQMREMAENHKLLLIELVRITSGLCNIPAKLRWQAGDSTRAHQQAARGAGWGDSKRDSPGNVLEGHECRAVRICWLWSSNAKEAALITGDNLDLDSSFAHLLTSLSNKTWFILWSLEVWGMHQLCQTSPQFIFYQMFQCQN